MWRRRDQGIAQVHVTLGTRSPGFLGSGGRGGAYPAAVGSETRLPFLSGPSASRAIAYSPPPCRRVARQLGEHDLLQSKSRAKHRPTIRADPFRRRLYHASLRRLAWVRGWIVTKVAVPHLCDLVVGVELRSRPRRTFLQQTESREIMSCRENMPRILGISQPRPSPADRAVNLDRREMALANCQVVIGDHLKDGGSESCVHVFLAQARSGLAGPWRSALSSVRSSAWVPARGCKVGSRIGTPSSRAVRDSSMRADTRYRLSRKPMSRYPTWGMRRSGVRDRAAVQCRCSRRTYRFSRAFSSCVLSSSSDSRSMSSFATLGLRSESLAIICARSLEGLSR